MQALLNHSPPPTIDHIFCGVNIQFYLPNISCRQQKRANSGGMRATVIKFAQNFSINKVSGCQVIIPFFKNIGMDLSRNFSRLTKSFCAYFHLIAIMEARGGVAVRPKLAKLSKLSIFRAKINPYLSKNVSRP